MGWELDTVERPLVEQLVSMSWHHTEGHLDDPARSGRRHFTEVLQEDTLRRQLHALNLRGSGGPSGNPGSMPSASARPSAH